MKKFLATILYLSLFVGGLVFWPQSNPLQATIATEVTRKVYSGNGTVFPYTFKIFAKTDLLVIVRDADGNETPQVVDSDYTVSGVGVDAGGNVTFTVAPASTETILILRNRPLKQETDYIEGGPFLANSHEDALDELTMLVQQLQEQLDRAIHVKKSATLTDIEISDVTAGEYWRWNLAGDGIDSIDQVSDLGTFLQSGTGAVSRTAASKMGEVYSLRDFDVTGDGSDETAKIQLAFTAAAGGELLIHETSSHYLISSTINVSSNTKIRGMGRGSYFKAATDFGDNPLFRNITTTPGGDASRDTGIVFESLRIDGNRANNSTGTEFSHGISLIAVTKSAVKYCWIDSPKGDGVYVGYYSTARYPEEVKIKNNWIYDTARNGVSVTAGKSIQVIDNGINTPLLCGIDIEPGNDNQVVWDILIAENRILAPAYPGIQIALENITTATKKGQVSVKNNIIRSPSNATYGDGIHLQGITFPISVSGNEIYDAQKYGIDVAATAQYVTLIGNIIHNADSYGIGVWGTEYNITGNTILADAAECIYVESTGERGTITGNLIVRTAGDIAAIRSTEAKDITITGNMIYGAGTGAGNGQGIMITGTTDGINHIIEGNRIKNFTIGIYLYAGTKNNLLGLNDVTGNGTNVTDDGNIETAAAPALSVYGYSKLDSTSNAVDATLGDGEYIGQIKTIVMIEASNSSTVTIAHHETEDNEVATFNLADETGVFMWTGTQWVTIKATCTFL